MWLDLMRSAAAYFGSRARLGKTTKAQIACPLISCALPMTAASRICSFDDFVRPHQHVRRNCQADLLRGFEVDDQLELDRLLDRKIGGFPAFQALVDISSGAPVHIR